MLHGNESLQKTYEQNSLILGHHLFPPLKEIFIFKLLLFIWLTIGNFADQRQRPQNESKI